MTIYYSASQKGFYDDAIYPNSALPKDIVEVPHATYQSLIAAQSDVAVIQSDNAGNPVIAQPPAPTLDESKKSQIALICAACAMAIKSGFTSSAWASVTTYGSNATDQANLVSIAQAGQGGSLWCASSSDTWALTGHTAAQVTQVLTDWNKYRSAQQSKYANLVSKINAATSMSAVEAIVWS
ncbi:hypothetical protein EO087_00315 [Dyella sp. M7H15-1]|uniref:DUF4376 domain-containing protein n=1 Tax=Dyella sp. M7H15-1 TaxID=2501295 RepID=UPI001004F017|nr:hypothetical protein [Dyella sp. M7H15-1]QAU22609.1 hypothetical protein EO087_00315 [Dyella sp. M7H15-1]